MQSIPWHCHVCGHDFDTSRGGLCRRCRKVACRSCLHAIAVKTRPSEEADSPYVCAQCLTDEEKKQQPSWSKLFRWRR